MNGVVDQLRCKVDEYEFEAEALQGTGRRGRKVGGNLGLIGELENLMERHREDTEQLEQVLRGLDDETLSADDVWEVRDLIEDYLELHRESPFEFESTDDIYDLILERFEEEEEAQGWGGAAAGKDEKDQHRTTGDGWDCEAQKAATAVNKAALLAENFPNQQHSPGQQDPVSKTMQEAGPSSREDSGGLDPGSHAAAFSQAMGGLGDNGAGAVVWQGAGLGMGAGGAGV